MQPLFQKRRAALKGIDKFWPVALRDDARIGMFTALAKDQQALSYLEDVWVARDPAEFRVFTLEFVRAWRLFAEGRTLTGPMQHFKSNPWFKDAVLKKVYKYTPPAGADKETPDEHGVTDAMLDFEWERDVDAEVC
jgi:template-activating factor I